MTLDIKKQKKWKYQDKLCIGCGVNIESGDELLQCTGYSKGQSDIVTKPISYNWFYGERTSDKVEAAKVMIKRLKFREKLMEGEKADQSGMGSNSHRVLRYS